MFFQIFLIAFLGCFQSAISIDNDNEIEQRFGAGDILGFKIMDGEPMNGPFTVSTLTIFKYVVKITRKYSIRISSTPLHGKPV